MTVLSTQQTHAVLQHFNLSHPGDADFTFLSRLLNAYTQRVPWGSAFRIASKNNGPTPEDRVRFAETFWQDVIERGGDGTCFESNYAFFALLQSLGYRGYLTINDMGTTVGCHSAIVLKLNNQHWLVDVGLPLYTPIPIYPGKPSQVTDTWYDYRLVPLENGTSYEVQRENHPSPYAFTLRNIPVDDSAYRARIVRDHEPDGFFLDKVIVNRLVDGRIWRYNGREHDRILQEFPPRQERIDHPIEGDIAETLSQHFNMDAEVLRIALNLSAEMI